MRRVTPPDWTVETEIRDYGDRDHIVLYTRDPYTYSRFRAWALCRREVRYTSGLGGQPIAVDLYFPRPLGKILRRLTGVPDNSGAATPSEYQRPLPGFSAS